MKSKTDATSVGAEASPADGAPAPVALKVPDGFKPSTAVGSTEVVPPVKPPRVAFPFEEIR